MSVKILQYMLLFYIIDHGQSDQLADLQSKLDYQLQLMKDKLNLFETEIAQLNKTIIDKTNNHNSGCGEDWFSYSDTKCFKVLGKKGSEVEAKGMCSQLESSSTLITIQSKEEQNFLSNRLKDYKNISDFVWIGLEFVDKAFQWMDGNELKFQNWDENAIKDGKNKCVQMSLGQPALGKWTDDLCQKKYQVICQKKQLTQAVISEEVRNLTKVVEKQQEQIKRLDNERISSLEKEIAQFKTDQSNSLKLINSQKKELDNLKQNPVPIGFIYVQLSGQSEPHTLWPQTTWSNISPKYAGLFFRAEGGKSDTFGKTQSYQGSSLELFNGICTQISANGNYRKLVNSVYSFNEFSKYPRDVTWSFNIKPLFTGTYGSGSEYCIDFKYSSDEIRPSNQAIRIWIRIK